jgi:hypothetical protein
MVFIPKHQNYISLLIANKESSMGKEEFPMNPRSGFLQRIDATQNWYLWLASLEVWEFKRLLAAHQSFLQAVVFSKMDLTDAFTI